MRSHRLFDVRTSGLFRRTSALLHVLGFILLIPGVSQAQELDVGAVEERYLRVLQISGDAPLDAFSLRPLVRREGFVVDVNADGAWASSFLPPNGASERPRVEGLEVLTRVWVNSRQPHAANDGSIWQGKGVSSALDLRASFRWHALSVTLAPTLTFTQNAEFELAPVTVAGMPEYTYPWRRMDLPQRFGPDSFWRLDPGQSEVRLSLLGATVGLSTRNLWWGPGIQSAILMSNNAGGFPHVFLGTRGPRDIGIGSLEANWIMGRLTQSDWFDPSVENDRRFLTGLVVSYSPDFLDGLSVGFARVFYGFVPDGGQPPSDLLLVFQGVRKRGLSTPANPLGDDDKDQMLSVFGRWVMPESGFEIYGEWARNDHAVDLSDFLLEPEHSQGYTLGLQKAIELEGARRLAVRGELTHLEREATFRVRPSPVYYSHHIVTQGYTQRGQVIGAGVGPGGIQQHLGTDLYESWGRVGLVLQRRVHDNDAYYAWAQETGASFDNHDVSIDVGLDGVILRGPWQLGAGLIYTRELNRYFYGPKVNNFNLSLSARWRPNIG